MKLKTLIILPVLFQLAVSSAAAAESAAQLFVPWPVVSSRLHSALVSQAEKFQTNVPDQKITIASFDVSVSGLRVITQIGSLQLNLNELGADAKLNDIPVSITLGQLSIDQIVEREISGVKVRVHVQASCGPIEMTQKSGSANARFDFDWSRPLPQLLLQTFDLAWNQSSWEISQFACTGPQGIDTLLQQQITAYLSNPASFEKEVAALVGNYSQNKFAEAIKALQAPIPVEVGASISYQVSSLRPTSLGIVADFLATDSGNSAPGQIDLPELSLIEKLSQDQPSLIAKKSFLEFLINQRLKVEPAYQTFNLQENSSFRSLIKSRFLQFFVWPDLMNYSKNAPFYLRLQTPRSLSLTRTSDGTLTFPVNLNGTVQSFRKDLWWNYISILGTGRASLQLSLQNSSLNYSIALPTVDAKLNYTAEYVAKFGTRVGFPKSKIISGVKQTKISGTAELPSVDLGLGGKYLPASLDWIDNETFVVPLK